MKKLRIITTGAKGQLGRSIADVVSQFEEVELIETDREELDVTKQGSLEKYLQDKPSFLPTVLINCAAYTAVDLAETHDEEAYALNSFAPAYLAMSCSLLDMMMIHISTDYVFDGRASEPYLEDSPKSPLSVYGETKSVGEDNVYRFLGLRSLVVRTSWLYSPFGENFVQKMCKLSHEKGTLRVVSDQVGCPTYAPHLADALIRIALDAIELGHFQTKVVHYSDRGACSWYDLAKEAIALMGNKECQLIPITTEEYGKTPATRPRYSVLSHRYLQEYYKVSPPEWIEGLKQFAMIKR